MTTSDRTLLFQTIRFSLYWSEKTCSYVRVDRDGVLEDLDLGVNLERIARMVLEEGYQRASAKDVVSSLYDTVDRLRYRYQPDVEAEP